jgi:hypothetical protein
LFKQQHGQQQQQQQTLSTCLDSVLSGWCCQLAGSHAPTHKHDSAHARGFLQHNQIEACGSHFSYPVLFAHAMQRLLQGDVTVWTYLYGNCSLTGDVPPSAGVEVNLLLTRDGKPFGGVPVDGVAMTGAQ